MELKGRWVQFAIRDVYYPTPDTVLATLHGDDVMSGEVVEVSGASGNESAFAVIRVEELHDPLVVPIECIRGR